MIITPSYDENRPRAVQLTYYLATACMPACIYTCVPRSILRLIFFYLPVESSCPVRRYVVMHIEACMWLNWRALWLMKTIARAPCLRTTDFSLLSRPTYSSAREQLAPVHAIMRTWQFKQRNFINVFHSSESASTVLAPWLELLYIKAQLFPR